MDSNIQMVLIEMPKGHAMIWLHALKTQFTIQGLTGAKVLVEMCESIEEAINSSDIALINEEERWRHTFNIRYPLF